MSSGRTNDEPAQALLWKRQLAPEIHAPSRALSTWLSSDESNAAGRSATDSVRGEEGVQVQVVPVEDDVEKKVMQHAPGESSPKSNALPTQPVRTSMPIPTTTTIPTIPQYQATDDPIRITHAVLAICLNLSTPQNQRVKTEEAFFDPATRHHERAMRKIISNLVNQLDAVQRLAILALPDPRQETVLEAVHKARRESGDDYLLFLYNNHGTLPPTEQGEFWVYDQDFPTQPSTYNPVFMSHVLDAAKPGAIFVLDSDNSGRLIDSALEYGRGRDAEMLAAASANRERIGRSETARVGGGGRVDRTFTESNVYFGATSHQQVLPIAEGLPRDAFTSCMISPLLMALRFSWWNDSLRISENLREASPNVSKEDLLTIPGGLDDRDTPLGELNWLLSAIIETIAWQSTPVDLFRKLFRSDPALNGLSKGFFLAQRVLRTYDCIPVSYPPIPSAHLNPLWQVWDLALDDFLSQLPIQRAAYGTSFVYRSPIMLPELLQAFGAQVAMGAAAITADSSEEERRVVSEKAKLDLPFAIHALLSNRLRAPALNHLTRYLDIGGEWPVFWAFQCGLDLLQPRLLDWQSEEDKDRVIYIFSRLVTHPSGPAMLAEERRPNGPPMISIFVDLLRSKDDRVTTSGTSNEETAPPERIASILFMMWKAIVHEIADAELIRQEGWAGVAAGFLTDDDALARQWALVVWTNVWFVDSRSCPRAPLATVIELLDDESVEVRATAVYAFHLFASRRISMTDSITSSGPHTLPGAPLHPEFIAEAAKRLKDEATHLIRNMMVSVIEALSSEYGGWFEVAVWKYVSERGTSLTSLAARRDRATMRKAVEMWTEVKPGLSVLKGAALSCIIDTFNALLLLSADPDTRVEKNACEVLDKLTEQALSSVLGEKLPDLRAAMATDAFAQKSELINGEVDLGTNFANLSTTEILPDGRTSAEVSQIVAALTSTTTTAAGSTGRPLSAEGSKDRSTGQGETNNLDWPDRLARYFDTTRLVWSDTPFRNQPTKIEQRLRYAQDQGMICESQADKAWSRHIAEIPLDRTPRLLRFHAFESTLAVIMDNTLELWDTEAQRRQTSINLTKGNRFRQANFFNQESESDSIITVSDHGIVRAYRHALTPDMSASAVFRVIEDDNSLLLTRLFSTYNQGRGELFLAGNTGDISIWSSLREQCVRRMPTGSDSRATAIDTEAERGNISIVGFHDGRVALYDQRQQHKVCVRSYDVHTKRILAVGMNVGTAAQEIVTTSMDGVMNVWDIRVAGQPITGTSLQRGLPTPPSVGSAIHKASGVTAMFTHSAVTGALDLCVYRLDFPKPMRTTTAVLPWTLPQVIKEEFQGLVFADFHPTRMLLAASTGPSVIIRGVEF